MRSNAIKNMTDVRDVVVKALENLRKNPKLVQQAHETANLSGKLIRMCTLQIEVSKLNKQPIGTEWQKFITETE
jgi:hypothetical protein